MQLSATYNKTEKLKSRKQLQELFAKGKRITTGHVRLLYLVKIGSGEVKCGVGLSSKNFRKAVHRNKIKRLLREAYRLQKTEVVHVAKQTNLDITMFLLYLGKELPEYHSLYTNVGNTLRHLYKHLHENHTENS